MSDNGGSTWPEQDAIDVWIKKHNIVIVHQHTLELKKEVTKPRIEVQDKLVTAHKEIAELKNDFVRDIGEAAEIVIEHKATITELREALLEAAKELESWNHQSGDEDTRLLTVKLNKLALANK